MQLRKKGKTFDTWQCDICPGLNGNINEVMIFNNAGNEVWSLSGFDGMGKNSTTVYTRRKKVVERK